MLYNRTSTALGVAQPVPKASDSTYLRNAVSPTGHLDEARMTSIFSTTPLRWPGVTRGIALALLPMRRYSTCSGRASRREFWAFALLAFGVLGGCYAMMMWTYSAGWVITGMVLAALLAPVLVIPLIAVTIRRLHDIDESGWLALLVLVPLGVFVFFPLMLLPSTPGSNRFGSREPDLMQPDA